MTRHEHSPAFKTLQRIVIAVFIVLFLPSCAQRDEVHSAQVDSCPTVEILVGFGVGGGTDAFARALSAALEPTLGTDVQVINIKSGGGISAYRELIRRPKDGCTMMALTSDYVVLALAQPKDIDLEALSYIARAHTELGLLYGHGEEEEGWVGLANEAQGRDRPLLIGGVGARSFDRMAVTLALSTSSMRYRYIPYNSSKQAQADLLGGRLDAIYEEYGGGKPLTDAKLIRPIVAFSVGRLGVLPTVPTTGELGLRTPPPIWRGLAVAKGVPSDIIEELRRAVREAMSSNSYKEYEKARALNMIEGKAFGQAFEKEVQTDLKAFGEVMGR
ncbi:MAG: tripartite tricarboxylate transporter substrate-binding protein [Pseudomonadota bacterium]